MRRVGIILLVLIARVVFSLFVGGWLGWKLLQAPIESTCPPSISNPPEPSGVCAGVSGLYAIAIGFVAMIILTLIAEWVWRRRRRAALHSPPAGSSQPS